MRYFQVSPQVAAPSGDEMGIYRTVARSLLKCTPYIVYDKTFHLLVISLYQPPKKIIIILTFFFNHMNSKVIQLALVK